MKIRKAFLLILTLLCIIVSAASCSSNGEPEDTSYNTSSPETSETDSSSSEIEEKTTEERFTKYDLNDGYSESSASAVITFDGDSADIKESEASGGTGVVFSDKKITITKEGTYILRGNLSDGQIIVEVQKTEKVQLVFDGVSVSNSVSAPVYIKSADKVVITLSPNTENTFTDAVSYVYEANSTKPNACIYSSDDLTINGSGTLNVTGKSNNGIGCKNDLKIVGGNINVSAANNALKGNGSISIKAGTVNITGSDDGIKSDDEEDPKKGYIYIGGGNITVKSFDDAIQAITGVIIEGEASVITYSSGKSVNCAGETSVAPGCLTVK